MVKKLIPAILILTTLGSCSSLKPLAFTDSKKNSSQEINSQDTKQVRFLDNISTTAKVPAPLNSKNTTKELEESERQAKKNDPVPDYFSRFSTIENASALQLKFAVLLNTEVEEVQDLKLFEYIDDWYGTRYCMGGTTKQCIDCSAFVQSVFSDMYSVTLPRTAREQYRFSKHISSTELKEGDLLFFNTRGGVSHVGIYLQNNKFVHASSSGGVMISDMYEPYWVRHLVGAGRVDH